jgi:hypothetical protein
MRTLAALTATALVALAGCGGDDSGGTTTAGARGSGDDAAAVSTVMRDYFAALGAGDGEKACSYLSDAGRDKIESLSGDAPCADVVSQGVESTGKEAYGTAKFDEPAVDGDKATVHYTVTVAGKPVEADQALVRQDGDWRLEASTPPGG